MRAVMGTVSLLVTFAAFIAMPMADVTVITSYSIHYTKLYEIGRARLGQRISRMRPYDLGPDPRKA